MIHLVKGMLQAGDLLGRLLQYSPHTPPLDRELVDVPYGDHRSQRLDLLIPPQEPPYPIIIYLHGGAGIARDKRSFSRICRYLASRGYLVCNTNYRLAPGHPHPAQIQDVAAAISWVVLQARGYGGDPSAVYLSGDSMGALLATWYAAASRSPALRSQIGLSDQGLYQQVGGLILFYGIYDLETLGQTRLPFLRTIFNTFLPARGTGRQERARLMSPLAHIGSDFPPTWLCVGERDPLLEQSSAFGQALAQARVAHEVSVLKQDQYPGAGHGFLNWHRRRCSAVALQGALRFLATGPVAQPGTLPGDGSKPAPESFRCQASGGYIPTDVQRAGSRRS